eukprot:6204112-Pleurochrysis_carterae.AAC.3
MAAAPPLPCQLLALGQSIPQPLQRPKFKHLINTRCCCLRFAVVKKELPPLAQHPAPRSGQPRPSQGWR